MADKGTQYTIAGLAGLGIIFLLYLIAQQTGDARPIPEIQGEGQMMGMAVAPGMDVNAGTPLDTNYAIHGWHPGYDPDPSCQPVTQSRHRYPAVPGGNISTVMHQGWSAMSQGSPAGNDWRLNPPEAAVI
jgi:hypothetical protein